MVRPEEVLKELAQLWIDLGREEQTEERHGEASTGVLRACAMTLITIADEAEDPANVGETIALLMREHPSRSVVIRMRPAGECLESRVFAQCWMPFGQRRQICCEQIEITAGSANLNDIPPVVLPLAVPDLPVILWIRSPRLVESPAFPKIAGMSNKVILDAAAFHGSKQALLLLHSKIRTDRLFADLAWSRITRWRETISQIFANRDILDALPRIEEAFVRHQNAEPRPEAIYLAAWLQNGLRRAGSKTRVILKQADGGPVISGVRLAGPGCRIEIECDNSGAVEIRANEISNRTIFPEATDYLALREELSISTRDPAFDAAVATAVTLL